MDQFFRMSREWHIRVDGPELRASGFVLVPAGTHHNVVNSSKTALLKLYTIYAPPNHPAGTVHKTKAEAEDAELAEALRVEYCTDIKD